MAPIPDRIIGHEKQCGELLADIAHGNITHAYLFTGPQHLGKFTVARWFAWRILADSLPPAQAPVVRDLVERLIHPDLLSLDMLWMEDIQDDWKTIGKFSNVPQQHRAKAPAAKTDVIGIEDVRAMQGRLFETGSSPHLVCLIRSVERMQPAAANAFLKVLEEPPPRVVFLLTAESDHAVLPTVLSRTRVVRFHPLKATEMQPLLEGREDDDAAFALHLAQGAPGSLVSLLANPDMLRERRQLHGQAKQFWQAPSVLERLQWIMGYADGRQDLRQLLFHLALTLREHPEAGKRDMFVRAYMDLVKGLETNAHRGLLLERFALAVSPG